jgi:hypothetical protein
MPNCSDGSIKLERSFSAPKTFNMRYFFLHELQIQTYLDLAICCTKSRGCQLSFSVFLPKEEAVKYWGHLSVRSSSIFPLSFDQEIAQEILRSVPAEAIKIVERFVQTFF